METFTDDTVVALASFLSPHDILSLALTCKRFGDKHGMDKKRSAASREGSTREVRQRTESISIMEVAARTVLFALATQDERNALPRRGEESWIGLYHEFLLMFRTPLQFDKLAGDSIFHVDSTNRNQHIDKARVSNLGPWPATAICQNIMRAGKHRVSFQVNHGGDSPNYAVTCGIMRPTTKDISFINISGLDSCNPASDDLSRFSLKDYEMLHGNDNNVDCCLFNTHMGIGIIRKRWKKWKESELMSMNVGKRLWARLQNDNQRFDCSWMERIRTTNFKIEMVLNLDEGTLDVYKNDRRLGTLRSGLVGEYCWVVFLVGLSGRADSAFNVSISR